MANATWFNGLPKDVQALMLEVGREISKEATEGSMSGNAAALKEMAEKKGGKITTLTGAALETLAVLAEARMDDEVLTGAEIEAVISGRQAADCDEAAGATRIKRLRDALGNQLVGELLIRTVPKRGYMLNVDPRALRVV